MKTTAVCGPRSGWATPSLREARKRQRTTEPAGDPLIRRRTLSERSRPPMSNTLPVNYQKTVPDVLKELGAAQAAHGGHGLDRLLHTLVMLRASQDHGCAFCIPRHQTERA